MAKIKYENTSILCFSDMTYYLLKYNVKKTRQYFELTKQTNNISI